MLATDMGSKWTGNMTRDPVGILTLDELRRLLEREEGQYLEFKSLWDRSGDPPRLLDRREVRDTIAEYLAAFANAEGGLLLLGVDDDGTPWGHGYPDEAVVGFFGVGRERLRPPVTPRTQRMGIDGQEVLLLEVDAAPEAVMMVGNGFPYRVGDQVIQESQDAINARKRAYRTGGYERLPRAEASLGSLDLDLARATFD